VPQDEASSFAVLEDVLAEQFTPLFAAAGEMEFGIRAIDFLIDEISDVVDSTTIAVEYPHLAMPLGSIELIRAQLRGIARALTALGSSSRVNLSVRNISDPAEARALRRIRDELDAPARLDLGLYITSPRGALSAEELGQEIEIVWVELRLLQAAMFGLPAEHLLTREPLDRYSSRGLISVNPRESIDSSVEPLLDAVARIIGQKDGVRVGIRVSGAVSEGLMAALYRKGFRRFAVDSDEVAPARLALGKAISAKPVHANS
jgi:pyruvate,orthophosphate dikinase